MEKGKKIKLFVGLFYLILVGLFLYFFFSKFSFQEITTYEFVKNNRDYFNELRQTNFYLLVIAFFLFTIIWVLAGGFGNTVPRNTFIFSFVLPVGMHSIKSKISISSL